MASGKSSDSSSHHSGTKQEEGLRSKIKNFFSNRKHSTEHHGVKHTHAEYIITNEVIKDICHGSPIDRRLKVLKDLCETVKNKRLEQHAVEVLWQCVEDLLQPTMHRESRVIALKFLACLCRGQYEQLGILRAHFFNVVKKHDDFSDLPERLEVFRMLSQDGKDLEQFEDEAGPFLLAWMRDVMSSSLIGHYLQVLVNVVKYNAAYVDEDVLAGIVLNTCLIAKKTRIPEEIDLCLLLLDTVVRYSYLPRSSLHHFLVCMCQIVNSRNFTQEAWKLIKKLLGTHLGHTAIYTMCCILQNKNVASESEAQLMRGAVFFIGMALWGSQRIESLKHPVTAVLPAFIQAVEGSESELVAHEVSLSVTRLVTKHGKALQALSWSCLLDLTSALLKHLQEHSQSGSRLEEELQRILDAIESLIRAGQCEGDEERIFNILETCPIRRPENSVLLLVEHKAKQINAQSEDCIKQLNCLTEKYYKEETRTGIRVAVLDVIANLLSTPHSIIQEELLTQVLCPCCQGIENDPDVAVRKRVVTLICDVTMTCHSSAVSDLLAILRKVVLWPFSAEAREMAHSSAPGAVQRSHSLNEAELVDLATAVDGLLMLFKKRLYDDEGGVLAQVFSILLDYLHEEYSPAHLRPRGGVVRQKILVCLLELRADSHYRLGLPDESGRIVYSSHVLCRERTELQVEEDVKPTILPYAQIFSCLQLCLQQELSWSVLCTLLERLPRVLHNKTLLLSAEMSDLDLLCSKLTLMVNEKSGGLLDKLLHTPPRFTKSDFHTHIFPVLSSLVAYHQYLDKQKQREVVQCLEFGLVSRCARVCVRSLTVCALESPGVMMRQLPSVLLRLSQITATVSMAVPLMEFLSSLLHLPELYANFVEDQYMSIFAIALPYTNPCKYTHYTVSLAYHVIAMWFLKCRIAFRKDFVGFIIKGLRANVLRQFDETAKARVRQNQDSSDRYRTQSLNDEAMRSSQPPSEETDQSKGRQRLAAQAAVRSATSGSGNGSGNGSGVGDDMSAFHRELTETCVDMMATYTFSTFSCLPKRSPTTEFLLEGGQSQSWLLGNKIITITTSGGAKVTKAGLCEKCLHTARAASEQQRKEQVPGGDVIDGPITPGGRRRHRSAAVRTSSQTVVPLKPLSQDDLQLSKRGSDHSVGGQLARIPSEGLDSAEDLRRHGSQHNTASLIGGPPAGHGGTLKTRTGKIQAVDNVLLSLKAKESDTSIFSTALCNCWCTHWAEVRVRRAAASLAWTMRIQNEQELSEVFPDFSLADISNLFKGGAEEPNYAMSESGSVGQIDSQSLGENEYENLLQQHFHDNSDAFTRAVLPSPIGADSSSAQEPEANGELPDVFSEMELRKTASSPDFVPDQPGDPAPVPRPMLTLPTTTPAPHTTPDTTSIELNVSTEVLSLRLGDDSTTPQLSPKQDGTAQQSSPKQDGAAQKNAPKQDGAQRNAPKLDGAHQNAPKQDRGAKKEGVAHDDAPDGALRRPRGATVSGVNGQPPVSPTADLQRPNSLEQLTRAGTDLTRDSTRDSARDLIRDSARDSARDLTRAGTDSARGSAADLTSRAEPITPRAPESMTSRGEAMTSRGRPKELVQGGISPSFVFLQLYHQHSYAKEEDRPLLLPNTPPVERSVKVLDRIYPYETHKIGVLYVAPGQAKDEVAILQNRYGSARYMALLGGLGHLLRLRDCEPSHVYLGGLDHERGNDGQYAYAWHDEFMQVIFHVATLMPVRESDAKCTAKKLHIGNDYVSIVYNDSCDNYNIGTIKGQFDYVNIVIEPLDHESNAVTVQCKNALRDQIGGSEPVIISDARLPLLVRQMAIHANLASIVLHRGESNPQDPYASNWLERLRQIKRVRAKVTAEQTASRQNGGGGSPHCEDFTEYC